MKSLDEYWYKKNRIATLLWPFSLLFRSISFLRRMGYRIGLFTVYEVSVPVIVVGNVTVGGTGKTPMVVWLASFLREQGFKPGIVSRGYGGKASQWPQQVRVDSDPTVVGDEPILLARRTGCPVAVAPKRVRAAGSLLQHEDCDIIIADDGLQHYALHRDVEIAVIDGVRRLGNGYCLPAGPLREPASRLRSVDFVVTNGLPAHDEFGMSFNLGSVYNLGDQDRTAPLEDFRGKVVHAVAGIGHPARFFSFLKRLGLSVIEHPFADHHIFSEADLDFGDDAPVIMTEKDAVKCRRLCCDNAWFVTVNACVDDAFTEALRLKISDVVEKKRKSKKPPAANFAGA